VVWRHILPNAMAPVLVAMTLGIPAAILTESGLSFLGLGVQPPTPSWGVMLSDAQSYVSQAPRLAIFPGIAVFLCSLSFNLLGDGLRDTLDPRTTR
jgi:peptide/nickel transport system permease protein